MSTNTRVIVVRSEGGRYLDTVLQMTNYTDRVDSIIADLDYQWCSTGADTAICWIDFILGGLKNAGFEAQVCTYIDVTI